MIAERGVAGKIDGAILRLNDIPAPKSFVAVEDSPAGEMQGRNAVDRRSANLLRFTPIEFMSGSDLFRLQQPGHAARNDEDGVSAPREPA